MNRRIVITFLIMVSFAALIRFFPFQREVPLRKPFEAFPMKLAGWSAARNIYYDDDILANLGVSDYLDRIYVNGGRQVELYIGYYKRQKEGLQIHSPKHCLPGGGLALVSERSRTLMIGGEKVHFVEAVYQKEAEKHLFLYWYRMKDRYITNDYKLKLWMIINSLLYHRNEGAFIRISSPVAVDTRRTVEELEEFIKDFLPQIAEFLPA